MSDDPRYAVLLAKAPCPIYQGGEPCSSCERVVHESLEAMDAADLAAGIVRNNYDALAVGYDKNGVVRLLSSYLGEQPDKTMEQLANRVLDEDWGGLDLTVYAIVPIGAFTVTKEPA